MIKLVTIRKPRERHMYGKIVGQVVIDHENTNSLFKAILTSKYFFCFDNFGDKLLELLK